MGIHCKPCSSCLTCSGASWRLRLGNLFEPEAFPHALVARLRASLWTRGLLRGAGCRVRPPGPRVIQAFGSPHGRAAPVHPYLCTPWASKAVFEYLGWGWSNCTMVKKVVWVLGWRLKRPYLCTPWARKGSNTPIPGIEKHLRWPRYGYLGATPEPKQFLLALSISNTPIPGIQKHLFRPMGYSGMGVWSATQNPNTIF